MGTRCIMLATLLVFVYVIDTLFITKECVNVSHMVK